MAFADRVLDYIPRATKKEREAICAELEDHLADHRDALEEKGVEPEKARREAETAMGDPAEIGRALNAQLSPFWLWVKWGIQSVLAMGLVLILCFSFAVYGGWPPLKGPADALTCAWENWQVRRGDAWDLGIGDSPLYGDAVYSWRCWEVMRVGEELVCLTRVDMTPFYGHEGYYCGYFHFCTYNEDLFTPANGEILGQLTVTPESEVMVEKDYHWGWFRTSGENGVQTRIYEGLVREGDTYVDVTYDRFGTYVTMRCPMTWELWSREEVEP